MISRPRALVAAVATALVLAACGGAGQEPTTTTAAPTTSTTQAVQALAVAYDLQAGQTYVYEIEMDQTIEMSTTGSPSALAEEDVPGHMLMKVSGPLTVTYEVAEGPEPETFEITITADIGDLAFEVTVDGETFDGESDEEMPDFADLDPGSTTIVVDKHGKVIDPGVGGNDMFGELFGDFDFGAMSDVGNANLNPTQFFGPVLPPDEIEPGDSWSDTTELPLFGEDQKATIAVTSTYTGTETVDGVEAMVIDTTVATSAVTIDFAEFITAMFEAFIPEGEATPEQLAELERLKAEMRMLFDISESTTTMRTWFDPGAGVTLRSTVEGGNRMRMDVNMPDEETGDMVAFTMDMATTQSLTYRLVQGPRA